METVNQENNEATEKTFTQAEVDAIVGDRLKRDRAKYADYDDLKAKAEKYDQMEEANKTELQKAIERGDALQTELDALKSANSIREIRQKVAEATGVPTSLLTENTEEECQEQAQRILEFSKPKGYPKVRDGGEVTKNIGKQTTRQQFADWMGEAFGN